jgi:hypothetical protein
MKEQKRKAVLGMYPTRACVEIAVEAFCDAGFRTADISIVLPEKMTYDDFSAERVTALAEALPCDVEVAAPQEQSNAPAMTGLSIGARGSFVAAGPVGQNVDDPTGPAELAAALIDLGIPEYETEDYAGKVLEGNALLSVHCDSPEKALAARRLHGDLGGMDVFIAHCADRALNEARSMAHSAGK